MSDTVDRLTETQRGIRHKPQANSRIPLANFFKIGLRVQDSC
jgi:hypothetical protein